MEKTESQIAKIQLGNFKKTSSYVHCSAEKAPGSEAELYSVAELPMLNPAALESCEQICQSLSATLKRAYKKNPKAGFENAVSEINEEVGKLVSLGQGNWLEKLGAVIAVKENGVLHIATAGKIAAFLFRNGEFTDISCSSKDPHPLKTFENLATGKIKLDDIIIFSTSQLLNHVSLDRLKKILEENQFLTATQKIIEILKNNAGPEVAFATLLNQQVPLGKIQDEEIDLENYVVEPPSKSLAVFSSAMNFFKDTLALAKNKRKPATELPKIKITDRLKRLNDQARSMLGKSQRAVEKTYEAGKRKVNLAEFKAYSPWKKFLFISIFLLLLAGIVNIYLAAKTKKTKISQTEVEQSLNEIQKLLSDAETYVLYKEEKNAVDALQKAQTLLAMPEESLSEQGKENLNALKKQFTDLTSGYQKESEIAVNNLGNLGSGQKLFKLNNFLGAQSGNSIVSYNLSDKTVQDGVLMSSESIADAVYIKDQTAVIYNKSALLVWEFEKKFFSKAFTQNVPAEADFGGIKFYSTNSRVYVIDKLQKQITSFLVGSEISKPVISVKYETLESAQDLAIDGSIYVLTQNNILKFQSGKLADFNLPFLFDKFSGPGKIQTLKDWKNIYLLDIQNNRLVVIDKKANLVATYKNPAFNNLKDFYVDEPSKTVYILNDSSLLKATLP